jgi:hypothetical protein
MIVPAQCAFDPCPATLLSFRLGGLPSPRPSPRKRGARESTLCPHREHPITQPPPEEQRLGSIVGPRGVSCQVLPRHTPLESTQCDFSHSLLEFRNTAKRDTEFNQGSGNRCSGAVCVAGRQPTPVFALLVEALRYRVPRSA